MPVQKGEIFSQRDVYIDYPYETVMFRWDHINKQCYKKFYGKTESDKTVSHDNKLFNDALLYGNEITQAAYLAGKDG